MPDAAIDEAQAAHFIYFEDIAAIDDDRAAHGGANVQHVQRLELVPLGDEQESVATCRAASSSEEPSTTRSGDWKS